MSLEEIFADMGDPALLRGEFAEAFKTADEGHLISEGGPIRVLAGTSIEGFSEEAL